MNKQIKTDKIKPHMRQYHLGKKHMKQEILEKIEKMEYLVDEFKEIKDMINNLEKEGGGE